jgi:DNA-binding transcriptional regulator YhcF (GntR family)
MILEVATDSPIPAYEQIRDQIAIMAATGVLPAGFRLPSIRQLAGDLGLAPGTVARAYRELEAERIVATRAGRGTLVAEQTIAAEQVRQRHLLAAANDFAAAVRRLGVTPDQALAMARARLLTD